MELNPDHPGFKDQTYRARRNAIAQIALDHEPGTPVTDAPYVEQEHEVWRQIYEKVDIVHQRHACREYLEHSAQLGLSRDRIPQLEEVSRKVQQLSGFRLEPVAGLVLPKVFLSTLGQGTFLSTQYIRHHSSPLYTPEPDVVHELIGHAATLASPRFARLNRLVGLAAARTRSEEAMERLGRIYWFTIEFGLLLEDGDPRAYGAGLLSSAGELESVEQAELIPLDFDVMEAQEYDVTRYQPALFYAESLQDLEARLGAHLESWRG